MIQCCGLYHYAVCQISRIYLQAISLYLKQHLPNSPDPQLLVTAVLLSVFSSSVKEHFKHGINWLPNYMHWERPCKQSMVETRKQTGLAWVVSEPLGGILKRKTHRKRYTFRVGQICNVSEREKNSIPRWQELSWWLSILCFSPRYFPYCLPEASCLGNLECLVLREKRTLKPGIWWFGGTIRVLERRGERSQCRLGDRGCHREEGGAGHEGGSVQMGSLEDGIRVKQGTRLAK